MVAGHRNVIGKNILHPGTVQRFPVATGVFDNMPEIAANFQVVLVLAGDLAGLATDALGNINEKSEL